jgi:hypothetical protein
MLDCHYLQYTVYLFESVCTKYFSFILGVVLYLFKKNNTIFGFQDRYKVIFSG